MHTVFLDRQGKMMANLEGNRFTVKELGTWSLLSKTADAV